MLWYFGIIYIKIQRRVILVYKAPNVLLLINEIHFSSTLFYKMYSLEPYLCSIFLARIFFYHNQGTKRQYMKEKDKHMEIRRHAIQNLEGVRGLMEHGHRATALLTVLQASCFFVRGQKSNKRFLARVIQIPFQNREKSVRWYGSVCSEMPIPETLLPFLDGNNPVVKALFHV